MTIAFQAASAAQSSPSASSTTITWPGAPPGQLLLAVFGFEGVAGGSGPYVASSSQAGWERAFFQAPSGSGCGLEVWNVQFWSSGPTTTFNFVSALPYVAQGLVYTGQFTGAGDVIRASSSQAWTGNNPQAPAIFAFANEMLIAVAAEQMAGGGFGTPTLTGWTQRLDSARGGVSGNVEITAAESLQGFAGTVGPVPWAANAASPGDLGATGIFAIRGASALPTSSSPLIIGSYPVPVV